MTAYTPIYTSVAAVQAKTGLTNTEVDLTNDDIVRATIEDAEREVEVLTGRKWTNANSKTDFIDGPKKDVLGISGTKARTIQLSEYPIQSITACLVLNTDGTTYKTYDTLTSVEIAAGTFKSDNYWVDTIEDPVTNTTVPYGKITLINDEWSQGIQNIKISYTYGYATVPTPIRNLATCLAGIRVWLRFLGGSYNFISSYSIPQQTVSKGNLYERGMQNVTTFTTEAQGLLDRIGRRPRRLFYATGSDR